ncbi:hypothetical protein KUCAC02_023121, partial [Chaenocephalus aceratus]
DRQKELSGWLFEAERALGGAGGPGKAHTEEFPSYLDMQMSRASSRPPHLIEACNTIANDMRGKKAGQWPAIFLERSSAMHSGPEQQGSLHVRATEWQRMQLKGRAASSLPRDRSK